CSGRRSSRYRLKSAGSSFRWARSPPPPKITSVTGAGRVSLAMVSRCRRRRRFDSVSAELLAQCREQPFRKRIGAARPEPGEERCGQDRDRHVLLDRFIERPASFARILHIARDVAELGVL